MNTNIRVRLFILMDLVLMLLVVHTVDTTAQPPLITSDRKQVRFWGIKQLPSDKSSHIYDRLLAEALTNGSVRVIVENNVPFAPEGYLEDALASIQQRKVIEQAQDDLLHELVAYDATLVRRFQFIPYMALDVDPAALDYLFSSPLISNIEEDIRVKPLLRQSTLIIGADLAWRSGATGSGQTVAIVDTGVDLDHSFLAGKVVEEACYSSGISLCPNGQSIQIGSGSGAHCDLTYPDCFHGTHVAGIAAGNALDIRGIAPDATLMSIQVASLDYCDGIPCIVAYDTDLIAALERVFELRNEHAFAAINLSLGGGQYREPCDDEYPAMKAAIDNLRSMDIATVIASGNENLSDFLAFPACISTAISVGASTSIIGMEDVANFSNTASFLDLLAPGEHILSSVPNDHPNNYAYASGTSMAAPHVAGAWAVLKSNKPDAAVIDILTDLKATGTMISDIDNGLPFSRIDVYAALQNPPALTYVSPDRVHQVADITYTPSDILAVADYDSWRMIFDGSDHGITTNIQAFTFLEDGGLLLAFDSTLNLPGAGPITPSDVVGFTPDVAGDYNSGRFNLFFDGSGVGLSTHSEKIDGLHSHSDTLYFSTTGDATFEMDGRNLTGNGADIFACDSAGSCRVAFESSTISGLSEAGISSLHVESLAAGDTSIYLSMHNAFTIAGVSGDQEDVIHLHSCESGICGEIAWRGFDHGFLSAVDGLFLAAHESATLTVCKEAFPADNTPFNYGGDLGDFTLKDPSSRCRTFEGLSSAKVYKIWENHPTGWGGTDITCRETSGSGDSTWEEGNWGYFITPFFLQLAPQARVECTFTSNSSAPSTNWYISPDESNRIGDINYAAADILHQDQDGKWDMIFDASDVGISEPTDLHAFSILDDTTILLVFDREVTLPGFSNVLTPWDIVRFTPSHLGSETSGSFELYFDGSDVGLGMDGEQIDALHSYIDYDSKRKLLISTNAHFKVRRDGLSLEGEGQDILEFTPRKTGETTAGSWGLIMDGSIDAPGLGAEDIDALWMNDTFYMSLADDFTVAGASGNENDILKLWVAPSLGSIAWSGSKNGFVSAIDGLHYGELAPSISICVDNVPFLMGPLINFSGDLGDFALRWPRQTCHQVSGLVPGSYLINEDLPADWFATQTVKCHEVMGRGQTQWEVTRESVTIDLAADGIVNCTFYNNYNPDEPNDNATEATAIQYGDYVSAWLGAHHGKEDSKDIDFYRFTGQAGDRVDVNVWGNCSHRLRLEDLIGNVIDDTKGFHLDHKLIETGDYFLVMQFECAENSICCSGDYGFSFSANINYINPSQEGMVDRIQFTRGDILSVGEAGNWSTIYRGGTDINDFTILDNSILMVFEQDFEFFSSAQQAWITFTPWDIAAFHPYRLGPDPAGQYDTYFDGSDVGLEDAGEKIDAVFANGDKIYISTVGEFNIVDSTRSLRGTGEDILEFLPSQLGTTTEGTWQLAFDGSTVPGLKESGLASLFIDSLAAGETSIYISTNQPYNIAGISGGANDLVHLFNCDTGICAEHAWRGIYHDFTVAVDGLYFGKKEDPPVSPSITICTANTPPDNTPIIFGGDLGEFTLKDPESNCFTSGELLAGRYIIHESLPDDWYAYADVSCQKNGDVNSSYWDVKRESVTIDLAWNTAVTCTFYNGLDVHEPNDSTPEASHVSYDTARWATITNTCEYGNGDIDYYRFVGSAGDRIVANIDAHAIGSGLNAEIYLLAGDGDTKLDPDYEWSEGDPTLLYKLPQNGLYYLEVKASCALGSRPGSYYLTLVNQPVYMIYLVLIAR